MKTRFLSVFLLGALLVAAAPSVDPASGGVSLSELQAYGQVVLVGDGEIFVGEPSNRTRSGVVYVYRPGAGGAWTEAQRLTTPDAERADGFGVALALDGATLLVGGATDGNGATTVHVFSKAGGSWSHSSEIASNDGAGSRFGAALALVGGTAVIGAPGASGGTGAVHFFTQGGSDWTAAGSLPTDGVAPGSAFGSSVALDGARLFVGAPNAADQVGIVHVFEGAGTGWSLSSQINAPNPTVRGFGAALYVDGDEAIAVARAQAGGRGGRGGGGRGRGGGAIGSVHVLQYSEGGRQSGWSAGAQLMPFDGGAGFGSSIGVTDSEVWVGAAGANAIYVFERGDGPRDWAGTYKLTPTSAGVSGFAASLDVVGSTAVAGATGTDRGSGSMVVLERGADGRWAEAEELKGPVDALPSITGGERGCGTQGTIEVWDCGAADLVSFLSITDMGGARGERVNDIWGWTDPDTGREYALVARTNGTSFVDISDAENPVYIGRLPRTEGSPGSTWRDMKTYQNHAYIVSDAAGQHGVQVFDLTRLRDHGAEEIVFDEDAHYDGIASAHNIVLNEESGFAYAVGSGGGGETCGGGLHMIDIREPKNPTFAGCFADTETGRRGTGYSHDAMCVMYRGPDADYQGREICFGSNETAMSIGDVTDKSNPVALSQISYPNPGYTHQGWITEDHRYFFMGDESDEIQVDRNGTPFPGTRTMIYDIEDLDDPVLVKEFFGTTAASDHNLYIVGDLMYQSNYLAGLRILDISDPENPVEIGYFDTVPFSENTPSMSGSWSNYPFFSSGIVIVTSGAEGLFMVRPQRPIS